MTAKGKINAANVQVGDRIIVKVYDINNEADREILGFIRADRAVGPSATKTGEGVQVVRVLNKTAHMEAGHRRSRRVYVIETSVGLFEGSPIQTMMLAPEDAAGIKRAHVEALAEDEARRIEAKHAALVETDHELALAENARRDAKTQRVEEFTAEERAQVKELAAENLDNAHAEALEIERQRIQDECDAEREAARTDAHAEALAEDAEWDAYQQNRAWIVRHDLLSGRREVVDAAIEADHAEALAVNAERRVTAEALTASPEEHTGSTVVATLEKVWDRIRADHPELPMVVITTGSGEGAKWGHFRAESWKTRAAEGAAVSGTGGHRHELFLASEALAKGPHQVLQTMLHEAAHTLSKVRGIKDTSRQCRWHNAHFRKAAEEMGLAHSGQADKTHGFAFVKTTEATKARYADLLADLDREIRLTGLLPSWLGGTDDQDQQGGERIGRQPRAEGGETSQSGNVKATCGCAEPLIIRLSRKVLGLKVVRCDQCEELFTAA